MSLLFNQYLYLTNIFHRLLSLQNFTRREISTTKFILILFVVLIHCSFQTEWSINVLCSETIEFLNYIYRISVPCFFIISGYLYFHNIDRLSLRKYINKSKRRIRTLIIPYLLWNSVFLGYLLLKSLLVANSHDTIFPYGNNHFYNILFILKGFWAFEGEYPYAFAFWFVRNLIIFCALSPLAYFIIKHKFVFFSFMLFIIVCNIQCYGFSYFVLGAFLKYHPIYPRCDIKPSIIINMGLFSWLLFAILAYSLSSDRNGLEYCETIVALFFLLNLSRVITTIIKVTTIDFCSSSTFAIYALHQFFASPIKKVLRLIFDLEQFWSAIGAYFICFIILVIGSVFLWRLLYIISPKSVIIFSGDRR